MVSAGSADKSPGAVYEIKDFATLMLSASDWLNNLEQAPEGAELAFRNSDGTSYILVFSQKDFLSADKFIDEFIQGMRGQDDVKVKEVSRKEIKVKGLKLWSVIVDMETPDLPIRYLIYFYGGARGMVQLVGYCAKEIFEEVQPELESAFSGFALKKKK